MPRPIKTFSRRILFLIAVACILISCGGGGGTNKSLNNNSQNPPSNDDLTSEMNESGNWDSLVWGQDKWN